MHSATCAFCTRGRPEELITICRALCTVCDLLHNVIVPAWKPPPANLASPVGAYDTYFATVMFPCTRISPGIACARHTISSPPCRKPSLLVSWKTIQPCSQPPWVVQETPFADLHNATRALRLAASLRAINMLA